LLTIIFNDIIVLFEYVSSTLKIDILRDRQNPTLKYPFKSSSLYEYEQSLLCFLTRRNLVYVILLQRTNKYGGKKSRKCIIYLVDIAAQLEYARYDLRSIWMKVSSGGKRWKYMCVLSWGYKTL